jgi:hypothetical protein
MFVLCVVSKDRKAKFKTVKAQNQVRMKHRVQDNTKTNRAGGDEFCI